MSRLLLQAAQGRGRALVTSAGAAGAWLGLLGPVAGLHVDSVLHVFNVAGSRNITLALDEETLREARVLAAERGLSVSAFLRCELAGLVERQRGYSKARDAALRRLRRGQNLGGGKLPSREELHDRAKLR